MLRQALATDAQPLAQGESYKALARKALCIAWPVLRSIHRAGRPVDRSCAVSILIAISMFGHAPAQASSRCPGKDHGSPVVQRSHTLAQLPCRRSCVLACSSRARRRRPRTRMRRRWRAVMRFHARPALTQGREPPRCTALHMDSIVVESLSVRTRRNPPGPAMLRADFSCRPRARSLLSARSPRPA